ncbi:Uu.00g077640.m01.CDS01 [Anthostomella pinea]|uniref:Uu.00g077640.m01.CDS01 n=1 Tax=Anthostomella pinea TaxID=933095 RepID=A0AAI8YP84_9PEZI|nr:Uu.00g077640.m01.CDS01 [Anthostomella pinea]
MDLAGEDGNEAAARLEAELELLLAMYPDAITFSSRARELRYSHPTNAPGLKATATLVLRLPDAYPVRDFPEVISAVGSRKEDLRSVTKTAFEKPDVAPGEEVLDALVLCFQELLSPQDSPPEQAVPHPTPLSPGRDVRPKTVIIWLHHLLNTNKRKLALSPSMSDSGIVGVTKPGYPGVLVFSGPGAIVDSHVSELRHQKWQAFEVRYDTDDESETKSTWRFSHDKGIREVESMSDVVQAILEPEHRELFLSSIGVK